MRQKISKSFQYAINGLKIAWEEELNFKIEITCAILVMILGYVLQITLFEFSILILTIIFVLTTEALNTSLEELCDKFEPSHDPHVAKIKDLAAAAVLIASIGSIMVGIFIFAPYL